jgi:hypothetical protein
VGLLSGAFWITVGIPLILVTDHEGRSFLSLNVAAHLVVDCCWVRSEYLENIQICALRLPEV